MIVQATGWVAFFGGQDGVVEMKQVACWQEMDNNQVVGLIDWDAGQGLVVADSRETFIAYVASSSINERTIAIIKEQWGDMPMRDWPLSDRKIAAKKGIGWTQRPENKQ